jgi:hypothetical protein
MPTLQCGQCGATVDSVSICRFCRKYLCDRCGRAGCCARRPVDPEVYIMQGPPITRDDDDRDAPTDDDTDLYTDPRTDLDRHADDGGRVVSEDYEIGGEG